MISTIDNLYEYLKNEYKKISNKYICLVKKPEDIAKALNISPITVRKNLNILSDAKKIRLEVKRGLGWIIWFTNKESI